MCGNYFTPEGVTLNLFLHGLNEPKMQLAAMQSNLEWFDKYLGAK
jgi:hypothetical protein